MITAIVTCGSGETHIRRYDTDDPAQAKRSFIEDWINGKVQWQYFEFDGPECDVAVPAFTPEFLQEECLDDYYSYRIEEGVHIWEWYCCTGIHGSDEHLITGYFVPHEYVLLG
jgi:hypothetical protein